MRLFKTFPKTFWVANTLELFERYAWYGIFNLLAIYLTASTDAGGLGLSQTQKGNMMGWVTSVLYFLPVFSGAISDKIGYKKSLMIAFVILMGSYLAMGFVQKYQLVFLVFLMVAIGGALFKPVISATISKTTHEGNSSIGFGIFYMMVNLGALIGPFIASKLRETDWQLIFYSSSLAILLNMVLLLLFFKEPKREKSKESAGVLISRSVLNVVGTLKDLKFLTFLLIIVGFWSMYFQLFFTLPNYIDQWMNTRPLFQWLENISPALAGIFGTEDGFINPEMLINIDALYIVVFQLLVSGLVMYLKPMRAMIAGIFTAAIGIGLTFLTNNPFFLFFSILIFAWGEMASSPKITEYIGRIAPKDKIALYMGASFLPMSGGIFLAGKLSGTVYSKTSDKYEILSRHMESTGFQMPEINQHFSLNNYYDLAAEKLGMSRIEMTQMLWEQYHPNTIWYIFAGIGLLTVFLLFAYDRLWLSRKS